MGEASGYTREIDQVLIVEDDDDLRTEMAASTIARGRSVRTAGSIAEALAELESIPDLVIVDVRLPDGNGLAVVEAAAKCSPMPIIVATSGRASPEEAFRLAKAGAVGYLAKPHSIEELWTRIEEALRQPPDLAPAVAASVGHRPLRAVQQDVRSTMIDQALALSHGSRRGTAHLLAVSRQAIQQVLRARSTPRSGTPTDAASLDAKGRAKN